MKTLKLIICLMMLILSHQTNAQFNQRNPGIVKYDFGTYQGEPIQKGWLFSDSTYRRLYKSYSAADTMLIWYEKQGLRLERLSDQFESLKAEYNRKADADRDMIQDQQRLIGNLESLFQASQKDNEKLLKQFWHIGSVGLHKGTCVSVGLSAILIGYMAGKTF